MATADELALNTELSRAYRQVYAINQSMAAEKARGNAAGVAALLPSFRHWLDRYKAVSRQLGSAEFTTFDRFLLDAEKYVTDAGAALPGAVAFLPGAIGGGLLRAAVPFAVLFAAYLWARGKL